MGKRWGIDAAIVCGILGVICGMTTTITALVNDDIHFNFWSIFLIVFIIELLDIRKTWRET